MNHSKFFKKIFIITLSIILLNPLFVYAQGSTGAKPTSTTSKTPTTQAPTQINTNPTSSDLPKYNAGVDQSIKDYLCSPSNDGNDLVRCINRVYKFGVSFGAIVLVFFVVLAGYIYIMQGESGKAKAKNILQNSIVGMGILLGSYVLLYFINPQLTTFKPIQPPIFSAADLPSCEEVGFGTNCVITTGANAGQVVDGDGACAMPLDATKVKGFNATVHNPWDNNPATPDRHRTVHYQPNSPPPEGAVDAAMGKGNPSASVFAPISGKVYVRKDLGDGTGSYITITSDTRPGADCSNANRCASLAHIDPSVQVGNSVTAGQQVGITHMYTGSLGPHLHFELKLNGQWITGDGKSGTWGNMKSALSSCKANNGGDTPSGLVNANSIVPSLQVDMQYASAIPSSNNFTKTALYIGNDAKFGSACFLTKDMANKLKVAYEQLQKLKPGWKIKAWDCYRPMSIQQKMYDIVQNDSNKNNDGLVAKPTDTAQHPRGVAIDATLVDANGKDVSMPTYFDYYNKSDPKQDPGTSSYNSSPYKNNSEILNSIMTSAGLIRAGTEWWHFGLP